MRALGRYAWPSGWAPQGWANATTTATAAVPRLRAMVGVAAVVVAVWSGVVVAATLTAGALVLGWMYEHARSSVLIVALFHATLNMVSATEATEGFVVTAVSNAIIASAIVIRRGARQSRATNRPDSIPGQLASHDDRRVLLNGDLSQRRQGP